MQSLLQTHKNQTGELGKKMIRTEKQNQQLQNDKEKLSGDLAQSQSHVEIFWDESFLTEYSKLNSSVEAGK